MKKKRDIIFAITFAITAVFAICMLILYFLGMPKKTNLAIACTCIALSLVLVIEIIYNSLAVRRENKDAMFEAYTRSKAKKEERAELNLSANNTDRVIEQYLSRVDANSAQMPQSSVTEQNEEETLEELEKRVSVLQTNIDELISAQTKKEKKQVDKTKKIEKE
ncbi:MAG TPA: hypothetical protein VJZ69_01950 [Clostridia bacterium]|nr:hypothetical protein [Clostridia bacterium]